MKIRIKHWHGVCVWKWKTSEDECSICKQEFDSTCTRPDCTMPGDRCPPVWGECTHHFHRHCILKWLQQKKTCPLCRKDWKEGNSGNDIAMQLDDE